MRGRFRHHQQQARAGILALVAGLFFAVAAPPVQSAGVWRIYRVNSGLADSSCVAVTISPRGNTWIRHPPGKPVSIFDGYQFRTLPPPGVGNAPVQESKSGQVWTLEPEGMMEYRRGEWVDHPLADIRLESPADLVRGARLLSLTPAERDSVLCLLPDRLLKCDPIQNRGVVLRAASATKLGRFTEFVEGRDGRIWVAGTNGLARLPGPTRRLTPEAPWQEYAVPADWGVRWLDRPIEDEEGGVMVVAETGSEGVKQVLRLTDETWREPLAAPEGLRNAWRGTGGTLWGQSRTALFRRDPEGWQTVPVPGLGRAQLIDVAVESGGVFWLATSAGLVRHAPLCWRAPAEFPPSTPAVWDILETGDGTLWFAGEDGLRWSREGHGQTVSWPPGFVPPTRATPLLQTLRDNRLLVSSAGQIWELGPGRTELRPLAHPEGRVPRAVLGRARDGQLWVESAEESVSPRRFVELYDGRSWQPFFEVPSAWGSGANLLFLQVLKSGAIWLGTTAGWTSWEEKTKSFPDLRGAPAFSAPGLVETPRGRIWCGSGDAVVESDGKTWSVVRAGFGQVHALAAARDGSIWVGSERGLWRFLDGSWLSISREEGLPSEGVWDVHQDQRGELWVATEKGLSRYFREADLDPPVSSVRSEEEVREIRAHEPLRLTFHGHDRWDSTPARRLVFSHRIDEASWFPYSPATGVTLTNLPAGKHRVAVRAMDRNWNEDPDPALFEFTVIIPWYAEPRVVIVGTSGLVIALLLAWLAVDRHLRLLRGYAEVEAIVAQRTRELERANQELVHSQKMRALGTLAAGIAHDFNSILSIIKGSAQIIESHPLDREKVRTRIDRIKTMVEQGAGIVRAMLGLSRSAELQSRAFDLNTVVLEAIKALGDQFRQDVSFRFEPRPDLPPALGVADLCRQMLLNLILNAADAMGGQGTLQLRVGELGAVPPNVVLAPASGQRFVFVAIQDTGYGIDPQVLPRIFEPFFTTKAFSTRRGTGLGLTMVYEIAKETGLGLQVESTVGRGSTFTILLPVAAGPVPTDDPKAAAKA
jgi:signal transduction histidine kinase/ligand-binding sensor domain-containing protein